MWLSRLKNDFGTVNLGVRNIDTVNIRCEMKTEHLGQNSGITT
jgi:hypothetical protein